MRTAEKFAALLVVGAMALNTAFALNPADGAKDGSLAGEGKSSQGTDLESASFPAPTDVDFKGKSNKMVEKHFLPPTKLNFADPKTSPEAKFVPKPMEKGFILVGKENTRNILENNIVADSIQYFPSGYYIVTKWGKRTLLDADGDPVLGDKYLFIGEPKDGKILVYGENTDGYAYVDFNGKILRNTGVMALRSMGIPDARYNLGVMGKREMKADAKNYLEVKFPDDEVAIIDGDLNPVKKFLGYTVKLDDRRILVIEGMKGFVFDAISGKTTESVKIKSPKAAGQGVLRFNLDDKAVFFDLGSYTLLESSKPGEFTLPELWDLTRMNHFDDTFRAKRDYVRLVAPLLGNENFKKRCGMKAKDVLAFGKATVDCGKTVIHFKDTGMWYVQSEPEFEDLKGEQPGPSVLLDKDWKRIDAPGYVKVFAPCEMTRNNEGYEFEFDYLNIEHTCDVFLFRDKEYRWAATDLRGKVAPCEECYDWWEFHDKFHQGKCVMEAMDWRRDRRTWNAGRIGDNLTNAKDLLDDGVMYNISSDGNVVDIGHYEKLVIESN